MFCSSCGTECSADANFCWGCGSALERGCPHCSRPLRAGARFCEGCGAATNPEATAQAPADVLRNAPGPERNADVLRIAPGQNRNTDAVDDGPVRKTVTVLFVDLVGSTAFQESVDPEAARGAMTRYYDMVQRVVDQHEGTVAKFQGDGALAVFGVPEVAEDDAIRAVSTGVALQQAFSEIRDYVSQRYRIDVGLRVGINTGEVVIAAEDADLVGDVLNTAARLEAACTPGRVMVGEDTWRLTRSVITYEVLGEISVKGKVEPIGTFEVVEDSAFETPEDDTATPFVGRESELATMRDAYQAARESATARLVTVIGAPGVGKTRLAAELVASLDEARAFDLRCERAGTSTFAPIADLLRSVADIGADRSGSQAEASVASWLGDAPDADRLQPLLSSFVGGTDTFSTEELFFGARRLVELVAADAPAVLVVDDIQWAEPLLLDLLEHLIEWVTEAPVLVVGLARPELRDIRPSLAEPGRRVQSVVSLEGLDAAATAELAARLVGADRLPVDLLARLPESTEGNPLFVRELMQMLVDDGVIARGPGGWALTIDAEAVEVPPTIQSLLSTRVERMPVDERRLVELAAVVGPDFARGAVAAIADGWTSSQVDDVFRRLERKELIEATGSYWGNEPIYRFHHVLVRDAAYRRLLKGSRAELHLLVGAWTEETASALTGEHEVAIAHHFEQAFVYRHELGLDDDETAAAGARAAELLTVAADRALSRDDLPAAGSLALRAIGCLADDAAGLPALLVTANEALLSSGDVARATAALEQLETYTDEERLRQWAVCFRGQLTVLADPGGLDEAALRLDDAAISLDRLDDQAGVAKARQIRALALAALGRVGDCEAELDRALTAARKADDRRRVTAVLGAAPVAALWGPSPVPRAGGRCLDVIRLLRITTGSPAVEATSIRCQAVLEALRGRFETARTMLDTARQTAEEVGLRRDLMETEFYAGLVELFADDAVAAEPHLRHAHEGLGRLGIGADAGQAAAHLARALLLQGRIDEADELAQTSDTLAGQNTQTAIAARSVRAEVLSARGHHEEAVPLAEEAVAIAAGTDILVDHAQALAALARVLAAAGLAGAAHQAATNARALFEQKGASVGVAVRDEVEEVALPAADTPSPVSREGTVCTTLIERTLRMLKAGTEPPKEDLAADLVVVDERTDVNFGTMDRSSYLAQVESMADVGARPEAIEWLALRGESIALGRLTMVFADDFSRRLLALYRTDVDGRCDRIGFFDEGAIVPAYRRLERLFLDSMAPRDREPWASIVEWVVAHNEGDVETMEAWMRPDLQVVDHGTLGWGTQDRAGAIERFSETAGSLDYAVPTAIIRYGGGASLSRHRYQYHDGAAVEGYALTHNTTETTHRAEYFDLDQLDLALRRFDEVTGGRGRPSLAVASNVIGNRVSEVFGQVALAFEPGDWSTIESALADDVVFEDRRPGHAGGRRTGGAVDFIEGFKRLREVGFAELRSQPVETRGDDLALVTCTFVTADGLVDDRVNVQSVNASGLVDLVVSFEPDDLVAATAELDRRYTAALAAAGTDDGAIALQNRATAAMAQLAALFRAGDIAAGGELLTDDFVRHDRRSGVAAAPLHGPAAMVTSFEALHALGLLAEFDPRPIAIRGDDFALFDTTMAADESVELRVLQLVALRPGDKACSLDLFDAEDITGAIARVDELYLETLTPAEASVFDMVRRHFAAVATGDVDALNQVLNADAVIVDHQPLGWGALSPAEYVDRMASLDQRTEQILSVVHAINANSAVFTASGVQDGEPVKLVHWFSRIEAGRHSVIESFGVDDLSRARERFEGATAAGAGPVGRSNRCDRAVRELLRRAADHDWAGVEGLISPDLEVVTRRTGPTVSTDDAGGFVRHGLRGYGELGFRLLDRRVLAVRRDDLVLAHMRWATSDGDEIEWLAVEATDGEGRLALVVQFDPGDLRAAVAELEQRYAATLEPAHAAMALGGAWFTATVVDADVDALDAVLAEDFTSVDHRPLGLGSRSRADFLASVGARPTTLGEGLGYVPEVHAIDGHCALTTYEGRTRATDSGSPVVERALAVTHRRDGLWVDVDLYDLTQMDEARRRFEELRSRASTEPTDAAVSLLEKAWRNVRHAFNARDWVAFERLHTVDYRYRSFRAGPSLGAFDSLAEYVPQMQEQANLELTLDLREPIETSDDRFGLSRVQLRDPHGNVEERINIDVLDSHGRMAELYSFDPDDIDRALAEFHRLARRGVGESADPAPAPPTGDTNRAVERLMALLHAAADADPDGVMRTLSPHLERHDRRRGVSAPDMTNAEFAASTVELMRLRSEAPTTHVVATRGEGIALAEGGVVSQQGFEIRFLILLLIDAEDRIERIENFDHDDLAAGLARLDDLYAATLSPEDRRPFVRIARGIHARNAVATGRIAMVPPGAAFTGDGALEFPELEPDSDAAKMLSAAELGGITVMQPIHVARAGAVLVTMRTALENDHVVRHFVFRRRNDGQLVVHYFDEDALADALVAVDTTPDDAVAEPAARPTNLATITSDRVSEMVRNGVVDDLVDWWHPEATARDYSRLGGGAGGRDDFIEAMRSWREVWDIGQPDSGGPISIKGDHAALVEYRFGTVGSWSVDRLAVLAVGDDGRITELTFYDHEDREIAQAALDTLELSPGPDVDVPPSAAEAAPASGQPTNPADRLARQHGVLLDGEVVAVLDTLGVRLDDFALHRVNGPGEETALALSCWTNGELVTAQRFDEFDVQKAYFELDEWAGETLAPALWRGSAIRAWAKATQDHDWATARALLHPEYSARSHQLLGPDEMSGETLVRWFESLEARAVTFVVATPEVHAMSGVGGVVWEEFEQLDTDGFGVSNGGVSVVIIRDGKLAQSARFDDDQLLVALEMLEEIAEAAGAGHTIVYLSEPARALRPGG